MSIDRGLMNCKSCRKADSSPRTNLTLDEVGRINVRKNAFIALSIQPGNGIIFFIAVRFFIKT
ncbi:MAG: hypothetical protein WBA93_13210 [Microcoleaceae cyanobacterium]